MSKSKTVIPFSTPEVAAVFANYPKPILLKLLELRAMIFEVAAADSAIGEIEETLKWRQPSYLPSTTKSGTTIRIDKLRDSNTVFAMYVPCSTTLIKSARKQFGTTFTYEGKRALQFSLDSALPKNGIKQFISMSLRYHLDK